MTPELPIRGTITSWVPDDSIGRIRLTSGEEIRFGHSACVNLRPSVGTEVWVTEVAPHPLGGLRAKVVNGTGESTPDRATAALSAHEARERRRPAVQAEVDALQDECKATLAPLPSPWMVARQAGIELGALEAMRVRLDEGDLADLAPSLPALDDEGQPSATLRLYGWDWADGWDFLEVWTDPCFLPLGSAETDHIGLFVHPSLAAEGVAFPVVYRFHETSTLSFVAESAGHFVRMVDALAKGDDIEPLRGEQQDAVRALLVQTRLEEAFEDVERQDVHTLFWSGSRALEEAAAERLSARYRDRGWTYALASVEAQRLIAAFQERIDAAWKKLG